MKNFSILPSETIKLALKKISESGNKCIVVVNNKKNFLGTLSDGDIRRAILSKKKLSNQIRTVYNNKAFYLYEKNFSKINIRNIFLNKKIDIIPILDSYKRVVDIISWDRIFKNNSYIKKIKNVLPVIMAGGRGTRLKPFTNILPKPLIPIKGKTAIENIIDNFTSYGFNEFLISLNEKSELIKGFFHELNPEYQVKFIEEKKPLGTIGSLKIIKKNNLKENILVANCDLIFKVDLYDFYEFHKDNKFDITIVVSDKRFEIPYGVCKLSKKGHLAKVEEKPSFDFLVNIGLYLLKKDIIKLIPKNKYFDFNNLINFAQKQKLKIGVFPISESNWFDTGQWSELNKIDL